MPNNTNMDHSLVESQRVEFKRQLSDGLEKEVVAFLNARDGGLIYIGIDDDGQALDLEALSASPYTQIRATL